MSSDVSMSRTVNNIVQSVMIATLLTVGTFMIGWSVGWIESLNPLEVFAVFTSYSCTWLCSLQSRWNYPIGVITTASYSLLFWQWEAPALAVFNLYLVFSLIYGWFRWGADGSTRPVTTITPVWMLGYVAIGVAVAVAFVGVNLWWDPTIATLLTINLSADSFGQFMRDNRFLIDIALAAASGVAQLMLDNKKVENWTVWATINVVSIPYFISIGLYLVAFQYVFFLINTFIARKMWRHSMWVDQYNANRRPDPFTTTPTVSI